MTLIERENVLGDGLKRNVLGGSVRVSMVSVLGEISGQHLLVHDLNSLSGYRRPNKFRTSKSMIKRNLTAYYTLTGATTKLDYSKTLSTKLGCLNFVNMHSESECIG